MEKREFINEHVELTQNEVQAKVFTWNEIHTGDCVMQAGSTLILYSDGVGKFEAVVWTNHTHSGDQWTHIIDVKDFWGLTLFTCPRWIGPRMDDGNPPPHYAFGPVFFNYDTTKFVVAQTATAHSWC